MKKYNILNKKRKQTSNRDLLNTNTVKTMIFQLLFFPYEDNYFDQDSFV